MSWNLLCGSEKPRWVTVSGDNSLQGHHNEQHTPDITHCHLINYLKILFSPLKGPYRFHMFCFLIHQHIFTGANKAYLTGSWENRAHCFCHESQILIWTIKATSEVREADDFQEAVVAVMWISHDWRSHLPICQQFRSAENTLAKKKDWGEKADTKS